MNLSTEPALPEIQKQSIPRYGIAILFLILVIAAFLRVYKMGQSPPGLNQDEAVNAWNAYCLLKTGTDQFGVSWPVFYFKAFGGNNSPLFIYTMIPFQAIGGMNIYTTRLPGAVFGVLTVFVIYFTAKRLFNWQTGLIAAALLAIDPWNMQQSRWGHEITLAALAGLLPLALMLWARLPIERDHQEPIPWRSFLAGVLTAIVCYGYHSIRIFVPFFLIGIVLVTLPAWLRELKNRKGFTAILLYIVGFCIFFGPFLYQHIFHPEGIARHAYYNTLWTGGESLWFKIHAILFRYIAHFGPDFLFITGDLNAIDCPFDMAMFYWYMLPLMIIGLIWIFYNLRSSYPARLLLVYVLCYPTGDSFFSGISLHALRSFVGSCGLVLLAAAGAFFAAKWLLQRSRPIAVSLIAIFIIVAAIFNVRHLHQFFVEYNKAPYINLYFHADYVDVLKWLKPRLRDKDLVFNTTKMLNMPYVLSLVILDYGPHKWFASPREYITPGGREEWDYCTHYGNFYFNYDNDFTPVVKSSDPNSILYFIVRPGELPIEPVYRVYLADNFESLEVCAYMKNTGEK